MAAQRKGKRKNTIQLAGTWFNGDAYETDVEYIVTKTPSGFTVRAIDRFDGEEGTIYDVHHDEARTVLAFKVLWESTGRFLSVRLLAISPNRVSCTYTYTDKEMWFRKGTEPMPTTKSPRPRRGGGKSKADLGKEHLEPEREKA
jgi:hypothetical protein